jgi:hypothetical protein
MVIYFLLLSVKKGSPGLESPLLAPYMLVVN